MKMMTLSKRINKLEEKHSLKPEIDFSDFTDIELIELKELILKTGENKDCSLLSDEDLNRINELCKRAEK